MNLVILGGSIFRLCERRVLCRYIERYDGLMDRSLTKRINDNKAFQQISRPPFPSKGLLLEVTNFCNHKCIFCYNSHMTRKRGYINKDFAYRILNEAYGLGMREVGFYATGEPLMNKDLSDFVQCAKQLGYSYTYLTTNGALLNKEKAIELLNAGIDSVKFSINAGSEASYEIIHGHNDFKKVIKNLRDLDYLRKRHTGNCKIFVSCIVNKINETEKDELVNLVQEYSDDIVFLDIVNQSGLMYKETQQLAISKDPALISIPCQQLFNSVTINYEGYLTACCADFQNYLIIADLNSISLIDAWESEKFVAFRQRHLSHDVKGTMCFNCAYNQNEKMDPISPQYATLI